MNIKQKITKGEAIDIADVEIYNSQVDGVNQNGSKSASFKDKVLKDDTKHNEITELQNSISINHLSSYGDDSVESFYISTDTHGDGISVNGYIYDANRNKGDSGQFRFYLDSKEEIVAFAEKCLDALAIKEAKVSLKKEMRESKLYDSYKHPEAYSTYPNMKEMLMIKSGKYYWDVDKLVEITEDTPKDILDSLWNYDADATEPDYFQKAAMEKLEGLYRGEDCNWDSEDYQGINLSNLATFYISGGYEKGYFHSKRRLMTDKRKKKDVTVFVYADRTTVELDGIFDIVANGTLIKRLG